MFHQGFQTLENNGSRGVATAVGFLLFSSVWSSLMKHDKQVFELTSQAIIPIDLLQGKYLA